MGRSFQGARALREMGKPSRSEMGPHPPCLGFFKNQLLDLQLSAWFCPPPYPHLSLGPTYQPGGGGVLTEVGILAVVPPVGVETGQRGEGWRGPVSCWPSWEGQGCARLNRLRRMPC